MGVKQECDLLQQILGQVVELLTEAKYHAQNLPNCGIYEASNHVSNIVELCTQALSYLDGRAKVQIESIEQLLGIQTFSSAVMPTVVKSNIPNQTQLNLSEEERVSNGLNQNHTNDFFNSSEDQKAALIYDEIRAMDDDISKICYHTGIPDFIIATVRTHVFFTEHLIAIGPNQIILSRFTPIIEIATLWKSATENPLDDDDLYEFERLLAHEYVEALLMASGLSFRSPHSEAWRLDQDVGWINIPNSKYYGAHDLAPLANSMRPPFDHWKRLGLAIEKLPLANNGNLPTWSEFDNLVNTIKQLLL